MKTRQSVWTRTINGPCEDATGPFNNHHRTALAWTLLLYFVVLLMPQAALAAFGEDIEKPVPKITRQEDKVVANLVPRGKTTSINITFEPVAGHIETVEAMDFYQAAGPAVDVKDFRSALFVVTIAVPGAGDEAKLAISSNYFNSSTAYWLHHPRGPTPWADAGAQSIAEADLVQRLIITVTDGGPWDTDGVADGRVTLIGGPMDSFWGYAIGTLFIRFFGVFLVLGVLQIGMTLSGRFFSRLDKERPVPVPARTPAQPVAAPAVGEGKAAEPAPEAPPAVGIDPAQVAALALAVYLQRAGQPAAQVAALALAIHLQTGGQITGASGAGPMPANLWGQQGRTAIMDGRRFVTLRPQRSGSPSIES